METDNWVGKTIGKYRLERFIGCGGMGTLYRARHETLEKTVALKILHPNLVLGEQGEKIAARFIREARTAAQLKHQNIVEVYDIEREDELLYIVMEFILGKTIQEVLQFAGKIPLAESLYIIREVTKGLSAAHKRGVIHRDIKPANIMITQNGVVKLTDFGLARVTDEVSFSVAGQVFGTPLYSAPEQVEDGSSVDPRADLYSLGVSLFQMLAGETPYKGNNSFLLMSQHLTADIPSVRGVNPSVPPAIEQMILKLMAKKPSDRYDDAEALIKEVGRYMGVISNIKLEAHNAMEHSQFLRDSLKAALPGNAPVDEETPVDVDSDMGREGNALAKSLTQVINTRQIPMVQVKEKRKIKVLIVDDSGMMRKIIQRALEKHEGITVVGTAKNGREALDVIPMLSPDVITLDVNMPIMDGITTLKHIAVQFPCPVVMLSAFTHEGASTTFDCLTLGAIDFICKPSKSEGRIEDQIESLVVKIRAASRVHVKPTKRIRIKKPDTRDSKKVISRPNATSLIVMGAGSCADGTYLRIIPYILKSIPAAILALQYMEPKIFPAFSSYLNSYSRIVVKELEDKEIFKKGVCYLLNAPAVLTIKPSLLGAYCSLNRTSNISKTDLVDKAFASVAESFKSRSIAVLLTGKEKDGIEGLSVIKKAGGITLAQSPQTCVSPENVNRALEKCRIDKLVAESDIPAMLWHLLKEKK